MPVSAVRHQQRRNLDLTAIDGAAQGRFGEAIASLQISAALQQSRGNANVVAPGRHVERCGAFHAVSGVDAGARADESLNYIAAPGATFVGDTIQRSVAAIGFDVGIGA